MRPLLKLCIALDLILAPEEWTSIPVLVKMYKLLINELSNQIESNMSTRGTAGDDDDDDEVSTIRLWLAISINLSMEKLFSTSNQMVCPGILYANEPGFKHAYGKTPISGYWLVKSSKKIGFKTRKYACMKPGSFAYTDSRISFVYLRTEIYFSI